MSVKFQVTCQQPSYLEQGRNSGTSRGALEVGQVIQSGLKALALSLECIVVAAEGALRGVLRSEELLALVVDEVGHVEAARDVSVDGLRHWEGRGAGGRPRVECVRVVQADRELARVVAAVCQQSSEVGICINI